MKTLWAPWRLQYLTSPRSADCVFCEVLRADQGHDPDNLVLARHRHCYTILNRYPYSNGHLMVVPNEHIGSYERLELACLTEMMRVSQGMVGVLGKVFAAQGFNLGFNIGEAAGAGIAAHIHLHVVPRWRGDTNFLPVLNNTRVMPDYLHNTLAELRRGLLRMDPQEFWATEETCAPSRK